MSRHLKTVDNNWYRRRLTWVALCVVAAFVLLIARLFYLQVVQGEEFRQLSENNRIRLQSIDPPRGLIFDRNGILLVDNRPSFDLNIILEDAKPVESVIEKLSLHIDVPAAELMSKIEQNKGFLPCRPILLKQNIGRDILAAIKVREFDLPGVEVKVRSQRYYINKGSAAHLIGYLSEINHDELSRRKYTEYSAGDFIGRAGVEKVYEGLLRGKGGGRQVEVNAVGQVVRVLQTVDAQPGYNIYLTIDHTLQKKAEKLLDGLAGAVAAMDPTTGHILVLASSPSFDQNIFVNGMSHEEWNSFISNPLSQMKNRAVQSKYPPGSTYKIVTAIAGLEEGIIDKRTTFYCRGCYRLGNHVFRCWQRDGHGNVDVVKALAESCSVFFYHVGQELGIDRLAWYARACGLGSPTGIDLNHEAEGLVPTAAWKKRHTGIAWQKGETILTAIGQSYNLTTPLQMLVLISAIANEGVKYRPLMLKRIETDDGRTVSEYEHLTKPRQVTGRLPVSRQTLELVKKGLWEAVNTRKGTATPAGINGIEVSGKTGTAQVVSLAEDDIIHKKEKADHLRPHAWFVGFAPEATPQIAVVVIVEHGGRGSTAAAPIARELIKAYLSKETVTTQVDGLKTEGF